ncbi:deoxyribose-phosphate aldolase [Desulfobacterales bacterium HSG17]|nr:deoxyribose-phosphate aldolase [Desulfobacterales bacterium HSG17]
MDKASLAKYFDHTILKAIATESDVKQICAEARANDFFSVCVNPCFVKLVKEELRNTDVKVCSVVGFPLGAHTTEGKAAETTRAVLDGADEIDMVIQIGHMKSGNHEYVQNDIAAVVKSAGNALVKVIIETCYLTDAEKVKACELSKSAGAHFVKTSTGFGTGGATTTDIALMKKTVGDSMQIKASGGVKTLADAKAIIDAGADRLGASASVEILKELQAEG